MKCKNCGAEISGSGKFCGICGAANTEAEEDQRDLPDITATFDTDIDTNDKNDDIDDILNGFERISDKIGEDETTVSEKEVQKNSEGEDDKMNNENNEYVQQNENPQNSNTQGGSVQNGYQQNPQYGGNPNMPYGGYPQNGCYNPYGGYPQQPPYPAPYPQPQPYQQNTDNAEEGKKGKKTKQKRVVSVGIAVFCIIMVLILSALCGYLFETCLRHGIDPLRPGKPSNNMVIVENSISEELQNG